jgi:hypothetical protein
MPIVGGLDIHRKQITFDYLDTTTGEVKRGQIAPADRAHLRSWLARFAGRNDVAFALEGCTGWRYVAEELAGAGIAAHVAEPADTAFARGRKRHAKTDPLTDHLGVFSQLAGRGAVPRSCPDTWLSRPDQVMTAPPAISRTTPVIHAAASEARNTAAAATSAGVPSRFRGWNSAQSACWAAGISCRLRSVRMVSGAMQLARIPYGPAWAATSWVSRAIAALAAP